MNLRQLEYFVRVAELGGFSRAAVVLGIAQPALSRQVRLLEQDLRTPLFRRTGRGVVLTEAGQRLHDRAQDVLHQLTEARASLLAGRDEPAGRVVVGLPPSLARRLTLPLVERFRAELPRARLAIVEGLSTHIIEWIATGRLDLGLVHNPTPVEAIETTPVLDERLCLIGPAPGPTTPLRFADLAACPLIIPERMHAIRRLVEAQATLAGVRLDVAWEISGVRSILDLVRGGYGFAVLAAGAVAASGQPEAFVVRPIVAPEIVSRLSLALPVARPASALARRVGALLTALAHSDPL